MLDVIHSLNHNMLTLCTSVIKVHRTQNERTDTGEVILNITSNDSTAKVLPSILAILDSANLRVLVANREMVLWGTFSIELENKTYFY